MHASGSSRRAYHHTTGGRCRFTPCCLLYGAMPLAMALWASHTCNASMVVHQLLLAALLVIPNTATAFIFQSYMISVAAVVRRKLHAMKALTHMLTPVRPCLPAYVPLRVSTEFHMCYPHA